MKLRSLLLISAMAMVTPALASIPSSPEEVEATRQLNLQALAAAQPDGAATYAADTKDSGFAAESDATGDDSAHATMDDGTSEANAYVTDIGPSEDFKADVNPDITQQGSPSSQSNVDAPSDDDMAAGNLNQEFAANTASGVALTTVADPGSTLNGLTVQSTSGERLGMVDDIVLGDDGELSAVQVAVEGGSTVTVAASNFVFDRDANILVTHLSRAQIDAQPPA